MCWAIPSPSQSLILPCPNTLSTICLLHTTCSGILQFVEERRFSKNDNLCFRKPRCHTYTLKSPQLFSICQESEYIGGWNSRQSVITSCLVIYNFASVQAKEDTIILFQLCTRLFFLYNFNVNVWLTVFVCFNNLIFQIQDLSGFAYHNIGNSVKNCFSECMTTGTL